ncbi:M48 family metalloprotease [Flagellimonas onchidii]|uniref:M48 family metalloprotease n=1 Tax=Flagellimonas onchidii TaxID=2562684 RepID=UPI0010A677CA|nr:M48 family metalloprotease [Allomuricauda onchidii]
MKTVAISVSLSALYILVNLFIFFFSKGKLKSPDIINRKIILADLAILSILFYFIIFALEYFSELKLNTIYFNVFVFVILSVIPAYWFSIQPILIIRGKGLYKMPLIEQKYQDILGKYKLFVTNENFKNAYALGVLRFTQAVIISKDLIEDMGENNLGALIAHEVGHHKKKHLLKLYLVTLFVFLVGYTTSFYTDLVIDKYPTYVHLIRGFHGALFYGLFMWMLTTKAQKKHEYEADGYAASVVGKESIITCLEKLDELSDGSVAKGGPTHPPLSKRIEHIHSL